MAGPANSINEATTGITGFSGTAFVGSPATQHCVQVGGATTSTLVSVANGTTGQFLGANTGADPSWQAISSPFNPNANLQIFDDFLGYNNLDRCFSLGWSAVSFNNPTTADLAHPGITSNLDITAVDVAYIAMRNDTTVSDGQFILGGGALAINWVLKVATLSTANPRYILRVGLGDTITTSDQASGVYFEYSDNINSGNWVGKTASAAIRSTANSATAVTNAAYVNLGITVNAAATSVAFFVNGVQIANSPLTLNIPTTAITPFISVIGTVGTTAAGSVISDLFYLSQTLTSSR